MSDDLKTWHEASMTRLYRNLDPRRFFAPASGLYTCILPLFSNISKTAKSNVDVEHPWGGGGGTSDYLGHMTKMTASSIYTMHNKFSNYFVWVSQSTSDLTFYFLV